MQVCAPTKWCNAMRQTCIEERQNDKQKVVLTFNHMEGETNV